MATKRFLFILVVLLGLVLLPPLLSYAESEDPYAQSGPDEPLNSAKCPVLVETAMNITSAECDATGRNQACYGHIFLEAQLKRGAQSLQFSAPGNRVDVARIQSLQLSPMNVEQDAWGVALMRLQANLSATQAEDVTLLVFGDAQLENAVPEPTRADLTVTARTPVNVRLAPSFNGRVIRTLRPGQQVIALEKLADQSWLRVELEDETTGWVLAELLSQPAQESLNVGQRNQPYYRPMQAFYYRSGSENTDCPQSQTNGMLIQTPEGVGEITFLINEVNIQIGSTVYFEAQPGGLMTIATLEGRAQVRVGNVTQSAVAGTQVVVPLNADFSPAGPPRPPQPYDEARMRTLPLAALPYAITPAPALTVAEIQALLSTEAGSTTPTTGDEAGEPSDETSSVSGSSPSQLSSEPTVTEGRPDCPGQSCNAPGQGGTCPGKSCEAPGQQK